MKRREFIRYATGFSVGSLIGLVGCSVAEQGMSKRSRPNVVFLLAAASINLTNAVPYTN